MVPPGFTGEVLRINGFVLDQNCRHIKCALVDVWSATPEGSYTDGSDGMYRGHVKTDENGTYAYQTVNPGKYLTNKLYRPRHIHYKVHLNDNARLSPPKLVTQLYFEGDTNLGLQDGWQGGKSDNPNLVMAIQQTNTANVFKVRFDVVVDVREGELPDSCYVQSTDINPTTTTTNQVELPDVEQCNFPVQFKIPIFDRVGYIGSSFTIGNTITLNDVSECAEHCCQNPECQAISFGLRTCYLKKEYIEGSAGFVVDQNYKTHRVVKYQQKWEPYTKTNGQNCSFLKGEGNEDVGGVRETMCTAIGGEFDTVSAAYEPSRTESGFDCCLPTSAPTPSHAIAGPSEHAAGCPGDQINQCNRQGKKCYKRTDAQKEKFPRNTKDWNCRCPTCFGDEEELDDLSLNASCSTCHYLFLLVTVLLFLLM